MDLKEQRYIVAIADFGTISAAGEFLYISQPALSSYLKSVEDSLGVTLFIQQKRRYMPTEIGEIYLEKARAMLNLKKAFDQTLLDYRKGVGSHLRVGVQLRRSPQLIPLFFGECRQDFVDMEITFVEDNVANILQMLVTNKLDLGITNIITPPKELKWIPITNDPLVAISPRSATISQTLTKQEPFEMLDLSDPDVRESLLGQTIILPKKEQSLRIECDQIFLENNFSPSKIMEVRNIETIGKLVQCGVGIGFSRISYLDDLSQKDLLHIQKVATTSASAYLSFVYLPYWEEFKWFNQFLASIKTCISQLIGTC